MFCYVLKYKHKYLVSILDCTQPLWPILWIKDMGYVELVKLRI